ncbi:MAG: hypothetical protein DRJ14_02750 [Acidobacteria bacterium]|nr:MAG: hypothetical protein DRJ14_02750 [Acidobacteriota bacterium]
MNQRRKFKSISRICEEIDWIISNKDYKQDHKRLPLDLWDAVLHRELLYFEIDLFCITILKIANAKNRKLPYLERELWDFINNLPVYISRKQNLKISEEEELDFCIDYPNEGKKMLSRLIGLSKEILEFPDDHSKRNETRKSGSLRLLAELTRHYCIPGVKELFLNSVGSKNPQEQYCALEGLMNYYDGKGDEVDNGVIQALDKIIKETEDRSVVFICLQIQINAGIISEMSAVFAMDDWKDEHYYK